MKRFFSKLALSFFVTIAFVGPIAAVTVFEKARRTAELVADAQSTAQNEQDATNARYQYYLDESAQKNNLKAAMDQSRAQYEQLLKDQPDLIKQNQTTTTQTTTKPVVIPQVVSVPVTTSQPKTSTKTKTS